MKIQLNKLIQSIRINFLELNGFQINYDGTSFIWTCPTCNKSNPFENPTTNESEEMDFIKCPECDAGLFYPRNKPPFVIL